MKEISKVKMFEKQSIPSVITERKFLSHLRHPFIINMHYAFQDKDNLYIVMDLKSGGDLSEEQTSKDLVNKEFMFACLLLGLEFLHHNKIMHRDIKPENLVFDDKGYLCLTDLGVAKLHLPNNKVIESSGTPGYMAPEILTNQNHDLSSDFYSVGVMLYEIVFKKRPYNGKGRKEIKDQILNKEIYLKPDDLPPGWSVECAELITKLLKRKSDSRIGYHGIGEIKNHVWFYGINWDALYKKELESPIIIKEGENYNEKFCKKEEEIQKKTYDIILAKVNQENNFNNYYFNFYDQKKEKYFEQDGLNYLFLNPHEEVPLDVGSKLPPKDKVKEKKRGSVSTLAI